MARAFDFFTALEKRNYNPDGTVTEEYRQYLLSEGVSPSRIVSYEEKKQRIIKQFEEKEQMYLEKYGITYSQLAKQRGKTVYLD